MKPGNLIRRLSGRGPNQESPSTMEYQPSPPAASASPALADGNYPPAPTRSSAPASEAPGFSSAPLPRPGNFQRRPTNMSMKAMKKGGAADDENEGHISLEHGLDIVINCEVSQKDPAGITVPYRLLIPSLRYQGVGDVNDDPYRRKSLFERFGSLRGGKRRNPVANNQGQGNWGQSLESFSATNTPSETSERQTRQDAGMSRGGGAMGLFRSLSSGATGRRKLNKDPPAKQRDDVVVAGRLEEMGLYNGQPFTKGGSRSQQISSSNGMPSTDDRVEGMGLFNQRPSNPARNAPISAPQPQVETTIQGGEQTQAQPQQRTQRIQGTSLFPRRAALTSTRPAATAATPPQQSQPLSLRAMETRAEQQQQRDFERAAAAEGYPGRRPSKLDRVLGIGHARDEPPPPEPQHQHVAHYPDGAAAEDGDDYYSGEEENYSASASEDEELEPGPQSRSRPRGYSGIDAYKEPKGWRRFF
ncbi:MAG: hypothetical protein Q9191_005693 [Dirinaria sp. TL-2023a]